MNLYNTLTAIKADLGITGTSDDDRLVFYLEAASRTIDQTCNRHFFIESETRYYDGVTPLQVDDLLSIDTDGLTTDDDGDATFENTFATTDYILYPMNKFPKTKIELSVDSDYGSFGHSKRGCSIAGKWGHGDGLSATPYTSDTTLSAAITSTTATTCTVTSATNLSVGHTILIDSEQMYISGISSSTLTVTRGVNGTTAATHLISVTLYIYDYPADIEESCLSLAAKMFEQRGRAYKSEKLGDYSYTKEESSIPEPEKTLLMQYKRFA